MEFASDKDFRFFYKCFNCGTDNDAMTALGEFDGKPEMPEGAGAICLRCQHPATWKNGAWIRVDVEFLLGLEKEEFNEYCKMIAVANQIRKIYPTLKHNKGE
jgi:hypothetical protein